MWVREVLQRTAFFNADDGLVVSTNPFWLQVSFNTLTRLFDRVRLPKHYANTVGMVFLPCRAVGTQLAAVYKKQVEGEGGGLTYWNHHQLLVQCSECGADLAIGSLVVHQKTQHGVGMDMGEVFQWETPVTNDT